MDFSEVIKFQFGKNAVHPFISYSFLLLLLLICKKMRGFLLEQFQKPLIGSVVNRTKILLY